MWVWGDYVDDPMITEDDGRFYCGAVARLTQDGEMDQTFHDDGLRLIPIKNSVVSSAKLDHRKRLIVSGSRGNLDPESANVDMFLVRIKTGL